MGGCQHQLVTIGGEAVQHPRPDGSPSRSAGWAGRAGDGVVAVSVDYAASTPAAAMQTGNFELAAAWVRSSHLPFGVNAACRFRPGQRCSADAVIRAGR